MMKVLRWVFYFVTAVRSTSTSHNGNNSASLQFRFFYNILENLFPNQAKSHQFIFKETEHSKIIYFFFEHRVIR